MTTDRTLALWMVAALFVFGIVGAVVMYSPGTAEPGVSDSDGPANGAAGSEAPRRFTDDLGRNVAVTGVNRIVSLAPNLTEIAFAAGAGSKVVAVGKSDDFPPAVDSLPHVGVLPVDVEAIVAQQPDLVIATTQVNSPRDADAFGAVDLPAYYFAFPTLQSVFDGIRRMGELAGTAAVARDSAATLEAQFSQLTSRTDSVLSSLTPDGPDSLARPTVLVLAGSDVLYSFGNGSYVHTMVEAAGGRSLTQSIENAAPTLSEEFVLNARPTVIVGAFDTDNPVEVLLQHHPSFDLLPAVENGRVFSIDSDLLFRPGPRIVQGTERLAAVLHEINPQPVP